MKIAPIAEIKAHFSTYLKESEKGPIVVTKNGKPVAVLLGLADEDEIERLIMAYSPKFQSILARGGPLPFGRPHTPGDPAPLRQRAEMHRRVHSLLPQQQRRLVPGRGHDAPALLTAA